MNTIALRNTIGQMISDSRLIVYVKFGTTQPIPCDSRMYDKLTADDRILYIVDRLTGEVIYEGSYRRANSRNISRIGDSCRRSGDVRSGSAA